MAKDDKRIINIGILRGHGTGDQLATILQDFILTIQDAYTVSIGQLNHQIVFIEDKDDKTGRINHYHTYQSLINEFGNFEDSKKRIKEASFKDALRIKKVYEDWSKQKGITTVFRTAINAESLYQIRQEVKAIKEFRLKTLYNKKILIIRDQAEGFYANIDTNNDSGEEILFQSKYTKKHQQRVADFILKQLRDPKQPRWDLGKEFVTWAIYKHHLFGNTIENWFHEIDKNIKVLQPDTGLTQLLQDYFYLEEKYGLSVEEQEKQIEAPNLLVICSNEIGDLIYEVLMGNLNINAKYEFFTKNIFLAPSVEHMCEYQTAHGSADDIANTQKVFPYATLRIGADMLETIDSKHFKGIKRLTDEAIAESKFRSLKKTNKIVNCVIGHILENIASLPSPKKN